MDQPSTNLPPLPTTAAELLALVEATRAEAQDSARPTAVDRIHRLGKLTARERIAELVDENSFRPFGELTRIKENTYDHLHWMEPESMPRELGDGYVAGLARIDGRPVVVSANDFSVFGGSAGATGGRLFSRAAAIARQRGLPLVLLLDGGGHRIQDGLDSRHFADTSQQFMTLVQLSGWVPVVALMLGPGFAANTNYSALADFVVMVRNQSTMGIAGPALVKAATGEDIDKETLGGAGAQVDQHGLAHLAVDSESEAFDAARKYLSYLPTNADAEVPLASAEDPADRRLDGLINIVPANTRRAYDSRRVITELADSESFFELQPTFAKNIIVGWARLEGRTVGIIANQPMVMAGTLDASACEKAARFISLADAFGIPLVFLVDVPGFLVGSPAERSMLGRRSARIIYELGRASVPRISVVMRKGYGLGYLAMCGGRSFDADLALAWPTAEICAMNIEGAVDVAYRKYYEASPDPTTTRQDIIDALRARIGPLQAAEGFGVDDVIDPAETRIRICETLATTPRRRPEGLSLRLRGISPI